MSLFSSDSTARYRSTLHPRNSFDGAYDMAALCEAHPPLSPFVVDNPAPTGGLPTVDFSSPSAVRALNCALLVKDYGILPSWADILPNTSLVPPIPGRADYVHLVADRLRSAATGKCLDSDNRSSDRTTCRGLPVGPNVKVLDVGTGASCIFPLIGASVYGWSFVASELSETSVKSARKIVEENDLGNLIDVRRQSSSGQLLDGVLGNVEQVDIVMCNPPFYPSASAFRRQSERKARNLQANSRARRGGRVLVPRRREAGELPDKGGSNNFGGHGAELWCPGGEVAFVKRLIAESERYTDQCLWFSSIVSRKDNLLKIEAELKHAKGSGMIEAVDVVSIGPGIKSASIVMWSYMAGDAQKAWVRRRKWKYLN